MVKKHIHLVVPKTMRFCFTCLLLGTLGQIVPMTYNLRRLGGLQKAMATFAAAENFSISVTNLTQL